MRQGANGTGDMFSGGHHMNIALVSITSLSSFPCRAYVSDGISFSYTCRYSSLFFPDEGYACTFDLSECSYRP